MNIEEMAKYIEGEIIFGNNKAGEIYTGTVSINTRTSKVGDVFIALPGIRNNGHTFVEEAVKMGASAIIVEEDIKELCLPVIKVKSSLHALLALAHYKRSQYNGIVVAVTGSAGKTTVKELLSSVLSKKYRVDKNFVNYNNQIGMSLSILASSLSSDIWIMEVGISEAHDMQELGRCLTPDIALIINSGSAHESGLGEKGVAYHKASLIAYLSAKSVSFFDTKLDSCAFVCSSYKDLLEEAQKIGTVPIHTYSSCKEEVNSMNQEDLHCVYIGKEKNQGLYRVCYGTLEETLLLPYLGSFMAENVVAIFSVALYFGLDFMEIVEYISSSPKIEQRNNLVQVKEHIIIDDSYNANPVSMCVMVETIMEYKDEYSMVLLLGDMNELGTKSNEEHEALGEYIAKQYTTASIHIFWKGIFSESVLRGLRKAGFMGTFLAVISEEEFLINIKEIVVKPTAFLCKGSRSNALEKYVKALCIYLGVEDVI
ncbi:MAG: UDP-N-acetylmuramoyl-tripeptide--D-alanyl-D-alanine ligase [Desulfovibrionaceae bacterium]